MSEPLINPYTGLHDTGEPPNKAPFDPNNSWTVQSPWSYNADESVAYAAPEHAPYHTDNGVDPASAQAPEAAASNESNNAVTEEEK